MRRRCLFAVISVVVAATAPGCGYGGDDDEPSTSAAQTAPRVPSTADETGALSVEEFNDFLKTARPAFATSALRTAIEFANAGEGQASTTAAVAHEGAEGNSAEASVTVTRDGIADDSVRALRYEITLERSDDGTWQLRGARRTQRCQPGRGHQDFSAKPCR